MRGNETPYPIWVKFCWMVGIPDIITYANFQLRGSEVAGAYILPFSIDFDCRPYSTLALPCECVMFSLSTHSTSTRKNKLTGKLQSSYIILWISKTRMTTNMKPVYVYSLHEIVYVKKYAHLQGLFQTVFGRLL